MLTDIARADRTEQRVRDRMGKNIGIRVAFETARVRDLDSAKDQLSIFDKTMHVVADAAASRAHNFKSITPLEATMLYLSFMSWRGRRSTVPPAVSTKIQPAAMSHKLMPCSM